MVEREVEAWAAFLKDELFSEMVLVDESRSSGVMRPDYIATDPSWDGTHVIQGPPILIVKELGPKPLQEVLATIVVEGDAP